MNPIDSVGPVNPSLQGIKKVLETPAVEGPSMETLTQRFQAMMAQDPQAVHTDDTSNGVTQVLNRQEDLMHRTEEQINALQANAGDLTQAELQVASTQVAHSVSIGNFKMQAATSLASASNKSLQSLLKNS
jgi:type III secretion inner rod protein HrpB2